MRLSTIAAALTITACSAPQQETCKNSPLPVQAAPATHTPATAHAHDKPYSAYHTWGIDRESDEKTIEFMASMIEWNAIQRAHVCEDAVAKKQGIEAPYTYEYPSGKCPLVVAPEDTTEFFDPDLPQVYRDETVAKANAQLAEIEQDSIATEKWFRQQKALERNQQK